MKPLNNNILIVREKSQQLYSDLIVLPDTKNISSKGCRVLAVGKYKCKNNGPVMDMPVKPGDRVAALQYDGLPPFAAYDDLVFKVDVPTKDFELIRKTLPNGVELTEWHKAKGFTPAGRMVPAIKVKKGTMLQLINIEEISLVVGNEVSISDGK